MNATPPLDEILPVHETIQWEKAFFRNGILTKLARRILTEHPKSHRLGELVNSQWRGVPLSAPLVWFTFSESLARNNLSERELEDGILRVTSEPHHSLQFVNETTEVWCSGSLEEQNQDTPNDLDSKTSIVAGNSRSEVSRPQVDRALQILESIWPEMSLCIRSFVSHVMWVSSGEFWSSSLTGSHGLIFVNPQSHWSLAHYLETFVHEAAHLELYIRQVHTPLLRNPMEKGASPLRKDPRPLIGILHAAFVLCRTTEALRRFGSSELEGSASERQDALKLAEEFQKNLDSGLSVLSAQADWTPLGAKLFQNFA